MLDRTTRLELLAIADGYEVLADHAEKLNVRPLTVPKGREERC
jgi:hypothetical protein